MPAYRRLTLLAVVLLAVEFVVGLGGLLTPRREVFPFASWFLFSTVPNRTVEYDLEFRAVDERALDAPVRFSRAGGLVLQPHSIAAFNVVQQFGAVLAAGDAGKIQAYCRQIDSFCGARRLRYDVVKVVYDPVERYSTGKTLSRRVLGTFVTREFQ